ncbi:hypothetical protein SCP_0503730 [Sparassis crispa]|uniref:Uncharacterized protein n=1 Tax=Sparassis crispa TaxID=139825 RepID=A0A401GMA0_9APHY|nr:hypothetical protein SCP_0503730 [Sparassis crispa]GBE83325.1 hypothetical protein SCP_0503730 [Sparassis crispa]
MHALCTARVSTDQARRERTSTEGGALSGRTGAPRPIRDQEQGRVSCGLGREGIPTERGRGRRADSAGTGAESSGGADGGERGARGRPDTLGLQSGDLDGCGDQNEARWPFRGTVPRPAEWRVERHGSELVIKARMREIGYREMWDARPVQR